MTDVPVDFTADAPTVGSLDVRWIHGAPASRPADDPPLQVHWYDPHTVIARQSKSVNYEAPFLYLLFGNDRALLLDTGATEDPTRFPLRAAVDRLIAQWLAGHPRDRHQPVVAHPHGPAAPAAGDPQFAGRPGTAVVARELDAVQRYFGFTGWPDQILPLDLGGRVLDVTGSPGHHPAPVTLYAPWTR